MNRLHPVSRRLRATDHRVNQQPRVHETSVSTEACKLRNILANLQVAFENLCLLLAISLQEVDVEYEDLKANDGTKLIEKVGVQFLRPKPINISFDFKWADGVDVWVQDRWWKGQFVTVVGANDVIPSFENGSRLREDICDEGVVFADDKKAGIVVSVVGDAEGGVDNGSADGSAGR
ncbi:hypothetical protein LXL04_014721 [Taraxacum kok-saghyz]